MQRSFGKTGLKNGGFTIRTAWMAHFSMIAPSPRMVSCCCSNRHAQLYKVVLACQVTVGWGFAGLEVKTNDIIRLGDAVVFRVQVSMISPLLLGRKQSSLADWFLSIAGLWIDLQIFMLVLGLCGHFLNANDEYWSVLVADISLPGCKHICWRVSSGRVSHWKKETSREYGVPNECCKSSVNQKSQEIVYVVCRVEWKDELQNCGPVLNTCKMML